MLTDCGTFIIFQSSSLADVRILSIKKAGKGAVSPLAYKKDTLVRSLFSYRKNGITAHYICQELISGYLEIPF
jgi:hypothetical protein